MKKLGLLVSGVALAAFTVTSHAAIKINATRASNFASVETVVALPLNAAGSTLLSFNHDSAKKWILTFSAECAVDGTTGNVDIDVVVNGVAVSPTAGDQDAFCSANHTAGFDFWNRISITVVIQGIQGNNTVRILGRRNGPAAMWFGDSALVVHD